MQSVSKTPGQQLSQQSQQSLKQLALVCEENTTETTDNQNMTLTNGHPSTEFKQGPAWTVVFVVDIWHLQMFHLNIFLFCIKALAEQQIMCSTTLQQGDKDAAPALPRHLEICILVFRRRRKLEFLKATVICILYLLFFFAFNYLVKFSGLSYVGNLVPINASEVQKKPLN